MRTILISMLALLSASTTVHATVFPPIGTGRGDAAEELRCPDGYLLTGFKGRSGMYVDRIGPICTAMNGPAYRSGHRKTLAGRGGAGGSLDEQYCPPNAAVRQIFVRLDGHLLGKVSAIRLVCQYPANGLTAASATFGNAQHIEQGRQNDWNATQLCPGNEYATGLSLRFGQHVNAVGLICGPVASAAPVVVAPSAPARPEPPRESVGRGMEDNIDRPGSDYRRFDLSERTPESCQSACANDGARCMAWTYVRPGVHGDRAVCFLKSALPSATASTCCISGVPPRKTDAGALRETVLVVSASPSVEVNTDRPGSDYYRTKIGGDALPEHCGDKCAADASCKAWTFVKPGVQGPTAMCYLKRAVTQSVKTNCCVSGIARR